MYKYINIKINFEFWIACFSNCSTVATIAYRRAVRPNNWPKVCCLETRSIKKFRWHLGSKAENRSPARLARFCEAERQAGVPRP